MISPGTEVRLTGQLLLWYWCLDGCTSMDVPLSPPPQGSIPQPQNNFLTLKRLRRDSSFYSSLWYMFASYNRAFWCHIENAQMLTSQLIKGVYV